MSQCTPPTFSSSVLPSLFNGQGCWVGGRKKRTKYRGTYAQFFFRVGLEGCWVGGGGGGGGRKKRTKYRGTYAQFFFRVGLEGCWVGGGGGGGERKGQNTGEPMPNFFFRVGLSFFKGGLWHEGVKHSNHSFYHHFSIGFHGYLAPFQPPPTKGALRKRLKTAFSFFTSIKIAVFCILLKGML